MKFTAIATLVTAAGTALAAPASHIVDRQAGSVQVPSPPQLPGGGEPGIAQPPEGLEIPPLPQTPEIPPLPQTPEVPDLSSTGPAGSQGAASPQSVPQGQMLNSTGAASAAPVAKRSGMDDPIDISSIMEKLPGIMEALKANASSSAARRSLHFKRQAPGVNIGDILDKLPGVLDALQAGQGGSAGGALNSTAAAGAASSLRARQVAAEELANTIKDLPDIIDNIESNKGNVTDVAGSAKAQAIAARQVDVAGILEKLPGLLEAAQGGAGAGASAPEVPAPGGGAEGAAGPLNSTAQA